MKKIVTILLLTTSLFAKSLDTYSVDLVKIESIRYLGNEKISVELKENYWEEFFEFTRSHVSKKVSIKIDNISTNPYLFSPMYNEFELTNVQAEKFHKKFKALLTKTTHRNEDILEKKKNTFLHKMLKKYSSSTFLRANLITMYHKKETPNASKQCIELYENAPKETKEKIVIENYNKIYDCYTDLNKTTKALEFLTFVKKEINENDLYSILELEAYTYSLAQQPKRAKEVYVEALDVLKKTDFVKGLSSPPKDIIQKVEAMKKSEIKRLEAIILKLENTHDKS